MFSCRALLLVFHLAAESVEVGVSLRDWRCEDKCQRHGSINAHIKKCVQKCDLHKESKQKSVKRQLLSMRDNYRRLFADKVEDCDRPLDFKISPRFSDIDENGDGHVSAFEAVTYGNKMCVPDETTRQMFAAADVAPHDGIVSPAEFCSYGQDSAAEQTIRGGAPPEPDFDTWDQDVNGYLSRSEAFAAFMHEVQRHDVASHAGAAFSDGAEKKMWREMFDKLFEAMDPNGDGIVSAKEFYGHTTGELFGGHFRDGVLARKSMADPDDALASEESITKSHSGHQPNLTVVVSNSEEEEPADDTTGISTINYESAEGDDEDGTDEQLEDDNIRFDDSAKGSVDDGTGLDIEDEQVINGVAQVDAGDEQLADKVAGLDVDVGPLANDIVIMDVEDDDVPTSKGNDDDENVHDQAALSIQDEMSAGSTRGGHREGEESVGGSEWEMKGSDGAQRTFAPRQQSPPASPGSVPVSQVLSRRLHSDVATSFDADTVVDVEDGEGTDVDANERARFSEGERSLEDIRGVVPDGGPTAGTNMDAEGHSHKHRSANRPLNPTTAVSERSSKSKFLSGQHSKRAEPLAMDTKNRTSIDDISRDDRGSDGSVGGVELDGDNQVGRRQLFINPPLAAAALPKAVSSVSVFHSGGRPEVVTAHSDVETEHVDDGSGLDVQDDNSESLVNSNDPDGHQFLLASSGSLHTEPAISGPSRRRLKIIVPARVDADPRLLKNGGSRGEVQRDGHAKSFDKDSEVQKNRRSTRRRSIDGFSNAARASIPLFGHRHRITTPAPSDASRPIKSSASTLESRKVTTAVHRDIDHDRLMDDAAQLDAQGDQAVDDVTDAGAEGEGLMEDTTGEDHEEEQSTEGIAGSDPSEELIADASEFDTEGSGLLGDVDDGANGLDIDLQDDSLSLPPGAELPNAKGSLFLPGAPRSAVTAPCRRNVEGEDLIDDLVGPNSRIRGGC